MVLTSGHSLWMIFFYNFSFRGGHGGHGGHGQSIERILTLTRSGVGGSRLQLYTALYRRAARCPTNSLKLVCPRGGLPGSRADEAAVAALFNRTPLPQSAWSP